MILTGRKLEEIGLTLYGRYWPSIICKRLRRARRTIFKLRDEETVAWPGIKEQLAELIDDQMATLAALRDELREDVTE